MNFQRQPLPPLPSSPKLPTKPEFSGFSFSARFGAPTLLERMGHGPRSSGSFARPTLVHDPTPETSPPASLATQESQASIISHTGSNIADLSSPQDNQPTLDHEQNQLMELDTPQVGIFPSAWRFKSPPPLNALAISDLWADAERVQNEWASVERARAESVSNASPDGLFQGVTATIPSFNAPSRADSMQASNRSSKPAKPATTVHAQVIKQEDIVVKEELDFRAKTEDEETPDQQTLPPLGSVASDQELEPIAQSQHKATPEGSPQHDEHNSDPGFIETPLLSQAVGKTNPASDRPEAHSPIPQENHKQNQGDSEADSSELPNRSPTSHLDASNLSSQPKKGKSHPQRQPGVYSRQGYQAPIHRERGNMGAGGTISKGQHNGRSVGMKKASIRSPMNNGFRAIPTGPRGYRNRGQDFSGVSPRPRRSPSPTFRRSPSPPLRRSPPPPRHFSRPRSPLPGPDYPLRRSSPLSSSSQALIRARSPDPFVGRYSPPQRARGYGHYSPPSRRFASRSRSPPRRSRSPYTPVRRRSESPPPYGPTRRQATPPVLTRSRPAAYSPKPYTHSDTYAVNNGVRDVGYNRSRSFGLPRYGSPEESFNYPGYGTYARSPASPISQGFDQGGIQPPFSQGPLPSQQTTFLRSQNEGNDRDSNDRHKMATTSVGSRQESEREQTQTLKRKLDEADLRNEPYIQRSAVDEELVVAKRRRVDHSNEENDCISANGVSQRSQEKSTSQSAQSSSSTPKVPLLARLAGNSSSLQGTSAMPNLVEDVHRPLLAQRKAGILEERSPISKRITTQDASLSLQLEQTTDSIAGSKPSTSGGSSSGGASLSDRIHGASGRLPPLAPSTATVPSQPRRHSESGSNVSLVNRFDGIPDQPFSSHQDTMNTSQNIPLAQRITSGVSANSHGRPAPHLRRGGYGHSRGGGPRNTNGYPTPTPSHLTDQANQTSLANRLR